MRNKRFFALIISAMLIASVFTGCGNDSDSKSDAQSKIENSVSESGSSKGNETSKTTSAESVNANFTARDMEVGYEETEAIKISCSGKEFNISGSGATAKDGVLTISQEGTYVFSGSIDEGRIVVNVSEKDKVQIVLNDFSIKCTTHSPLYIKSADKVFLTLKDDTKNTITDGESYTALADDESGVDSSIFSRANLTINGGGSLEVNGNMKNGIVSKDNIAITSGNITVNAKNNGICGKDCVKIADGKINIKSEGDGIKSNNTEDTEKGYVYICGGEFNITSETDAIQAETNITIEKGTFTLKTGGGSENSSKNANGEDNKNWGQWGRNDTTSNEDDTASAKGLKSGGDIVISNATINADTSDDSIHASANTTINSGTINIKSGDDGIHAGSSNVINGGDILIEKSYEGIEGENITITGGTIELTASDDGVNASGGSDGSAMGGRPGANTFSGNSDVFIKITGGKLTVNATGDGIDSNGNITIEGGEIYVNGPESNNNAAFDYDGTATVTGGTLIAVGSSGMAQGFSDNSTQCSILYNFSKNYTSNDKIILSDSNGKELLTFTPKKQFNSVVITTQKLTKDSKYKLTVGNDSYDIEMTSTAFSYGATGGFGGMGGGMHGGNRGDKFKPNADMSMEGQTPPQMPDGNAV